MNICDSVSVVIPTFNYAHFLSEAINSIAVQSTKGTEIIVVDDGSTDETEAVCRMYKGQVRYIRQQHRGVAAARNRGLQESVGSHLLFLDADDVLVPHALECLLCSVGSRDSAGSRDAAGISIGLHQKIIKIGPSWERCGTPYRGMYMSATIVKRNVFDLVGLFDETMCAGEDLDWFFRVREQGIAINYLDEVLLLCRSHGNNVSAGAGVTEGALLGTCRASLARRRGDRFLKKLPMFGSK